jgi:ATP-dependent Clp protease adaptor protein ClpS
MHEDDSTETVIKNKIELPKKYKVLLHNDDYSTMEFVIFILKHVFHKNTVDAEQIMLSVHNQGIGVCGIYTFEIAESKVQKVTQLAR